MSTAKTIRNWYLVHKWTSLICTIFLLLLCITGLPLIFGEEIDEWQHPPLAELPADTPHLSLDRLVEESRRRFPGEYVRFAGFDEHEPTAYVTLGPSIDADPELNHFLKYDLRTGEVVEQTPPGDPLTFMGLMFRLHVDLFAGLPGELFMGFMGLLFVIAIVSGVVVYGPFMRKLEFGTVRRERSARLKWLDLHNLLGIVTLVWALVIGITGVINDLSTPLFGLWRMTEVESLLTPYRDKPAPQHFSSVQAAVDKAGAALPEMEVISVTFPDKRFGSPHHYVVWTQGKTPLTSQLRTPVLIDVESGDITAIAQLPWYLRALELSRPLHFGDYAGLPLKLLWALLDVITMVVLGSGLYLWLKRRSTMEARIEKLARFEAGATPPLEIAS